MSGDEIPRIGESPSQKAARECREALETKMQEPRIGPWFWSLLGVAAVLTAGLVFALASGGGR